MLERRETGVARALCAADCNAPRFAPSAGWKRTHDACACKVMHHIWKGQAAPEETTSGSREPRRRRQRRCTHSGAWGFRMGLSVSRSVAAPTVLPVRRPAHPVVDPADSARPGAGTVRRPPFPFPSGRTRSTGNHKGAGDRLRVTGQPLPAALPLPSPPSPPSSVAARRGPA